MKQFFFSFFSFIVFFVLLLPDSMAQTNNTSNPNDNKTFRDLLVKNASLMGISKSDVNDAVITDGYKDDFTGLTFLYVQQSYHGIRVFNTIISAAFKNDILQTSSGSYLPGIATKAAGISQAKSAIEAVKAAANHLGLNDQAAFTIAADRFATEKKYLISSGNIARQAIEATLVWVAADDKKSVKLAWNINIDVAGSSDWWNVRIDAVSGAYIQKDNWTIHEKIEFPEMAPPVDNNKKVDNISHAVTASHTNYFAPPTAATAIYRVVPFPSESPIHAPFSNAINPWTLAGAGNNAVTNGWHFDGTTNYEITRGNNVFAFLDRRANNGSDATRNWPDTSTTSGATLTFTHTLNPSVQPWLNVENKKVALDNLFYWNNIVHDVTYQYGLTEVAGNFQADNLGRGGLGNDYVNANAQDSAGYNNANFSTPNDGTSGRMQMYTWSSAPLFTVSSSTLNGTFAARENSFTAPNKLVDVGPVSGLAVQYDPGQSTHTGCAAALTPADLIGKIVLIDATVCNFIVKVKNAQNAGAKGVALYYPTLLGLGGTDASVTIPCVSITTATANQILAQINASVPVTITLATGIYLDGDLDNGIITHEYGHGVSNRLTGGPANSSCLGNAEQGGEGWSDYLALMLTTNWSTAAITDGPNLRPVGTYAFGQTTTGSGIRRYPYTTNISANPLTYADVAASTEVHNIGEVWCSAIWEMTWGIIQQVGSITPDIYNSTGTGGNVIALNLVMTGMKLQTCGPGFLDARNAILTADSILYNNAHKCVIWAAFAKRGMGYSAVQGLSTSATDQIAAFDLPAVLKVSNSPIIQVAPSAQQAVSHTLTCDCAPLSNYVVRDTIPAGFTYVSSTPSGTLSGNVLSFPATSFASQETKNFTITLQAPAAGCPVTQVINDDRDGNTSGGFTSAGSPAWTTSAIRKHNGSASWFGSESATVSSSNLASAATAASAVNNLSILTFWHFYNFENTYDGGVVELSANGGGTWTDASPYFSVNTYNTTMSSGTALAGRRAFSGTSRSFQQVMLNLSSFGTSPVQIRFRQESDDGLSVEGWYIDEILRLNGCGAMLKTGIYNEAGSRTDTTLLPIFVTSSPLPLTLLDFNARESSGRVALDWKTAMEVNAKNFDVEWSPNNTIWSTIATLSAKNQNTNNYNALHNDPVAGRNYYRLKMRDIDGRVNLSETKTVNITKPGNAAPVLVPNPVSTDATLYISRSAKQTTIRIYDAAGSLIRNLVVDAGIQQLKINTANLANGVYVIETTGTEKYITRMVVQK